MNIEIIGIIIALSGILAIAFIDIKLDKYKKSLK